MRQLLLSTEYGDYEFTWQKIYGSVYRLKGCFGQERLMVSDPVAIQYLLNSPSFCKSPILEGMANLLFERGNVMSASGDEHRRLRAALNVGFTAAAVRDYQPLFQKIAGMISEEFEGSAEKTTNVCPLLSTMTLAAISEAVLGKSLEELGQDFVANNLSIIATTASQSEGQVLGDAIAAYLPLWFWRAMIYFPTAASKIVRTERSLATGIGRKIVRERMDAAAKGLEKNNDVYSLLLNPDNSDTTKKLTEEDVVAQTGLILLAGQETTAVALAFVLLELARHPSLQDRLRAEIHTALAGGAGNVIYDSMPLLNAFIKEVLRMYPVGPLSDRIALEDAVIPLSEAITTLTGERISQIRVTKGQLVTMAVASYHRLASRWGDDADEFNPSRWVDGTTYQGDAVGPYGNLLSFNGGPRMCLGWRFAILEMQVILCEVIPKFSFAQPENEHIRVKYLNNNVLPATSSGDRAVPLCMTRLL